MILTAGYGDGHLQVARSLQQALQQDERTRVIVLDLFEKAHPLINAVTRFVYVKSLSASAFGFHYYGWSYYMTRNMNDTHPIARWINDFGKGALKEAVESEKPDAVVCTFPFGGASRLLKKCGVK